MGQNIKCTYWSRALLLALGVHGKNDRAMLSLFFSLLKTWIVNQFAEDQ